MVVNAAHDLRRRQQTRHRASLGWGDWELARQDEISVQAEAGVVLGVSEGTIAWRMSDVKKRLRAKAREDAK